MLCLLSRCSISEFLGAQDHKNEGVEQCEEPAGSWFAPLLQPSQAALELQHSLSLGRAAASEPHLAAFIAEFPADPTALLHCLCLSLVRCHPLSPRAGTQNAAPKAQMEHEEKRFSRKCRTGTQQSLVHAAFPGPTGQCQALFKWATRDFQSSSQPTLLRAGHWHGCNQALERCDTCRCPSIIPCLKWLKLLDSFSHFFGKAPILLIEGLCSSSLQLSQSTSSICSRVTPQWLHSQLC